jgi:hypothetical protein
MKKPTDDISSHPSQIENLATQVGFLRTIIAGLVAILAVAFTGGIFWQRLITYEQHVDNQKKQIDDIQKSFNELRMHLGDLAEPSSLFEVEDNPQGSRCVEGSVVIGLRYESQSQKLWIRCVSLGRAAWHPTNQ